MLEAGFVGVVLMDLDLPGLTGLEVVERLSETTRSRVEIVIITGHADMDRVLRALHLGARELLRKPFGLKDFRNAATVAFRTLLERFVATERLQAANRDRKSKLNVIKGLSETVDNMRLNALEALTVAAEYRDNETGAHIRRIARYIDILGEELGWSKRIRQRVALASRLHDVGKIGISDEILHKPGKLTATEFEAMKAHTILGHKILSQSASETNKIAARIALSHHEHWDGSGYPNSLEGDVIPLEARMSALGDVYDALRSPRTYKPAFDHATAVGIMCEGDERTDPAHFDPGMLTIFWKCAASFDLAYGADPEGGSR